LSDDELHNSPASRTSPRLVASQPMAYLFVEWQRGQILRSRRSRRRSCCDHERFCASYRRPNRL